MNMLNNIPNEIFENVVINMLEWQDIMNYVKSNKNVFKEFDRITWYKLIDNINIEDYKYNNYSKTNPLLPEHSYIKLMDQTVLCDDIKENIYFKLFTTKCLHKHLITKYKNNDLKECWYNSIRENNVDDYKYFNLLIDTTSIEHGALETYNLTQVIIPNSVKNIGNAAFVENEITEVIIPNSVEYIGNYAFSNNQISKVIIPNSVKSIGDCAFASNKLKIVNIPDSVKSIGDGAFYDNQIKKIIIPDCVTIEKLFSKKLPG